MTGLVKGIADATISPLVSGITDTFLKSKKKKDTGVPVVPNTEERAKTITDTAKEAQLKKKTKRGFSSTLLTSPLGVKSQGRVELKTLLGE